MLRLRLGTGPPLLQPESLLTQAQGTGNCANNQYAIAIHRRHCSTIRHPPFATRHLPSAIRHPPFPHGHSRMVAGEPIPLSP